jgi:Zn-dependent M28 family amino/carboxypeptidase
VLKPLAFVVGLVFAIAGVLNYMAHRNPAAEAPSQAQTKPAPAPPASQAPADGFDSSRAWEHLRQIVAIGPRPAGSEALAQTRAYITRQISALGLKVQEQPFTAQTPNGPVNMVNLIVRLPGKRPDKIVFTGHYDTKLFKEFAFVGANDAGSSSAFLVELTRALKDRPREFTWELLWLDGEEAVCANWDDCSKTPLSMWAPGKAEGPDNTYGSRHYVNDALRTNTLRQVRALILVDMIGERGAVFQREGNSTRWLKDIIWGTAKELGHSKTFAETEYPIEDDHVPFLKAGVPAVDIIDLDYVPHWHTATDTLDKLAARSLQIVGDVVLASLPKIEKRLLQEK